MATLQSLPVYIKRLEDGNYQCLWCDSKQLACLEFVTAHLRGKDHTKRCLNSGISPFGSSTHNQEAANYMSLYGTDPWARMRHWPACIADRGLYWECQLCGNKKFQTQRAVNDHLLEKDHHEVPSMSVERAVLNAWERDPSWPDCIVDEADFWLCNLCCKKFNAHSTVDQHLTHPRHLSKIPPAVKCDRFSAFIDPQQRECFLCEKSFSTTLETQQHSQDLLHFARWYEYFVADASATTCS